MGQSVGCPRKDKVKKNGGDKATTKLKERGQADESIKQHRFTYTETREEVARNNHVPHSPSVSSSGSTSRPNHAIPDKPTKHKSVDSDSVGSSEKVTLVPVKDKPSSETDTTSVVSDKEKQLQVSGKEKQLQADEDMKPAVEEKPVVKGKSAIKERPVITTEPEKTAEPEAAPADKTEEEKPVEEAEVEEETRTEEEKAEYATLAVDATPEVEVEEKQDKTTIGEVEDEKPCSSAALSPATHDGTLLEIFERAGREIITNHLTTLMVPPAPNLTKFSKKDKTDKQRQDEYEAEVEVFRALENLSDIIPMIVLHGLQYTHEQYTELVPLHVHSECKKGPSEEEGECDFVVVGDNFFLILQVKSPDMSSKNPGRMFNDRYKESVVQRNRTAELIDGIVQHTCPDIQPTILTFSVFNRLSKHDVNQFVEYGRKTDDEKGTIILKEDLTDFVAWWENNVLSIVNWDSLPEIGVSPVAVLLGLWCADKQNVCNIEKCTVSQCIMEIDEQLKCEKITRKPEATNVLFKKYLDIDCLTKEQADVFNSDRECLWINGPAGSGKTILLLGKIFDLLEKEKVLLDNGESLAKKIVYFVFGENAKRFVEVFDKFGIKTLSMDIPSECSLTEFEEFKETYRTSDSYSVAIVKITVTDRHVLLPTGNHVLKMILDEMFENHHVFIDDAQRLFSYRYSIRGPEVRNSAESDIDLLEKLKNLDNNCYMWASVDIAQYLAYTRYSLTYTRYSFDLEIFHDFRQIAYKLLVDHLANSMVTLSANLRNTVEICNILEVLRSIILDDIPNNGSIPRQEKGHHIHGFLPTIYVLQDYTNEKQLEFIMKHEREKRGLLPSGELGFIHRSNSWLERFNLKQLLGSCDEITVEECNVFNVSSMEWPAIVALFDIRSEKVTTLISDLYMAISRARVYCTIIIQIGEPDGDSTRTRPEVHKFLSRLSPYVRMYPVGSSDITYVPLRRGIQYDTICYQ